MSKVVRKQLLGALALLEQGTDRIQSLTAEGRTEDCIGLLTDCQDLAIALGTRIEKLHGEGTRAVSTLEDYCEKIYQTGEAMTMREADAPAASGADGAAGEAGAPAVCGADGTAEDMTTALRLLSESMQSVRAAVEEEFPDKLEVVFLPYKASMWDSLESVWMAARDDENCEAYVVPIPYYTRDEQFQFKDFCYEGGQYPKNVPVVDYRTYDLKLHHPDVIYVHNPYDQFNKVTSIAPEFYLKTIKDYTEKLVYIPYFVLAEIDPSDEAAVQGMSHFCFLPGTWYADQVILQSEAMRQIYINVYLKEAEKTSFRTTRAELEKRFLGTGSPKFDKVLRARQEEQELPEEWKRIILKPDGTRKKVIFYNTGLSAFLQARSQMLQKIQRVFKIFREYSDEVALLWRPHPLMEDTLKAMVPGCWKDYERIVKEYKAEEWGIYDDSPDLERAIAVSDAYFGDGSSVVQLCQKAGMPVMIQNVDVE